MTGHAYSLLDSYVYGFTITEIAMPFDEVSAPALAASIMAQLPSVKYPNFTDSMRYCIEHQQDFANQFESGLDQILDLIDAGIAEPNPNGRSSRVRPRPAPPLRT